MIRGWGGVTLAYRKRMQDAPAYRLNHEEVALALQADPSKVLNLGRDANERKVKTTDLSGFKVLAFATHGLVPGELN